MVKIALNQIKRNWKNSFGTFIVIFIASFFVGAFLILAISSQLAINMKINSKVDGFFVIFFAITFLISNIMIKIALSMSFELKLNQYIDLRILGFTTTKIRIIVFFEYLIFLMPIILIALIISRFGSIEIINLMVDKGIVVRPFTITSSPLGLIEYFIVSIIAIMIILFISTIKVNTIKSSANNVVTFKKQLLSLIIGFVSFVCGILIYYADGDFDAVSYLFGGLFMIVGLIIANYSITYLISLIFIKIFNKSFMLITAMKEFSFNLNKIVNIISMFVFIVFFLIYTTKFLQFGGATGDNKLYGAAFSFLGLIMAFMVAIYFVVIATNLIVLYNLENFKAQEVLKIQGYTKAKIMKHMVIQSILLAIIASIFIYIPTVITGAIFKTSLFDDILYLWFLLPLLIFTITFSISAVTFYTIYRKK